MAWLTAAPALTAATAPLVLPVRCTEQPPRHAAPRRKETAITGTSSADTGAPPTWRPQLQIAYPHILEVAPSPDGRHAVYVVEEPLLTEEKSEFISHLYLAAADGAEPVQLTFGEARNSGARWSPDGAYLAFPSARSGKTNLYVLRVSGGEAWALTRYEKSDIAAVRWAPDGTRLAFLMGEPPTEAKEKARKAKDDALQVDHVQGPQQADALGVGDLIRAVVAKP